MEHRGQLILNLHGVGPPGRSLDADEAECWLDGKAFESVLDAVIGMQNVRITFDDGNSSDVEIALPALETRGLRATFFILAGKLGHPGYLRPSDVRRLRTAGMEVGSHGMSHRSWRGLNDDEAQEELIHARTVLEKAAGSPIASAACPFGAYDRQALQRLKAARYASVFTSDGGWTGADAWLRPRNTLRRSHQPTDVAAMLQRIPSRGDELLRSVKRAVKRWR